MPKIFDRHDSEIGRIVRVNENKWFGMMQPQLLALANTDYGKDLLCIPKEFQNAPVKNIFKISKNGIFFNPRIKDGMLEKDWDFRIGAKWANVIRSRWEEIQGALLWQEANKLILPSVRQRVLLNNAFGGPYYPAAGAVNPCDGYVDRGVAGASFSSVREGAGTTNGETDATLNVPRIRATTTTDQYDLISRLVVQIASSGIPDTDVISAATLSVLGAGSSNAMSQSVTVVLCNPVDPANLANGDYDIASWTMTQQNSSDIAISAWSASAYNDFALNATGISNISKTGTSKFGLVLSSDRTGTDPTWASGADAYVTCSMADTAGTTSDPKLTGTSAAAVVVAASGGAALLLGIG